MPRNNQKPLFFIFPLIMFYTLFLFTGCASVDFKGNHDAHAYNLSRKIIDSNRKIRTARGVGWLKISGVNNNTIKDTIFKIAWITKPPDSIRITLFANGFPVETIASNGEVVSLFSHTGEHDLKTTRSPDTILKHIISMPVKLRDIIMLLSGQVPVKIFESAYFQEGGSDVIVLRSRKNNETQKIHIDHKNQITEYMVIDRKKRMVYKITFSDFMELDLLNVPSQIIIQDNLNRKVHLEIVKFYKNLPVKKSVFSLTGKR